MTHRDDCPQEQARWADWSGRDERDYPCTCSEHLPQCPGDRACCCDVIAVVRVDLLHELRAKVEGLVFKRHPDLYGDVVSRDQVLALLDEAQP